MIATNAMIWRNIIELLKKAGEQAERLRGSSVPAAFPTKRVASLMAEGRFSAALSLCRKSANKDEAFSALVKLAEEGRVPTRMKHFRRS